MAAVTGDDDGKRAAAEAAVAELEDGMVLGLGTGSTATFAVEALGRRVRDGLKVVGVPTSERTAALARERGIALSDLERHDLLDLTIDGADEVLPGSLALIKGLGGALLREKIVACASRRMTVIVDEAKLVERLGTRAPVPVEIVPFGAAVTLRRLAETGCTPTLRQADGQPYRTDGGGLIADCAYGRIDDPAALERRLAGIVGVIETGLFIDIATRVVVGGSGGVRTLGREARPSGG